MGACHNSGFTRIAAARHASRKKLLSSASVGPIGSRTGMLAAMQREGPQIEPLLHRLAECPPEFLQVAADQGNEGSDVVAIVCDVLRSLSPDRPPEVETALLAKLQRLPQPQLTLISIVCW